MRVLPSQRLLLGRPRRRPGGACSSADAAGTGSMAACHRAQLVTRASLLGGHCPPPGRGDAGSPPVGRTETALSVQRHAQPARPVRASRSAVPAGREGAGGRAGRSALCPSQSPPATLAAWGGFRRGGSCAPPSLSAQIQIGRIAGKQKEPALETLERFTFVSLKKHHFSPQSFVNALCV